MTEDCELNLNTNWENVLNLIKGCKFSKKYKKYYHVEKEGGYLIYEKEDTDISFFLFKEKKSINIYLDNENYESIEVNTSLEIDNFIKVKKKQIKNAYFKGKKGLKYCDNKEFLGIYLDDDEGLEFIEKEPLDKLEIKEELNRKMDYTPNQYSKYFYEYFINENKEAKGKTIKFEKNKIRDKIFSNILNLREKKNLKTFKFTGPTSIGKSFTLFRLCHTYLNMAYINLKTLNGYKNNLFYSYSIIISELERFSIRERLSDINILIENNYDNNNSFLDLLLSIMEFLDNTPKLQYFVFAFDQFKLKYIKDGFMEKIKEFKKIKIVLCSSINDKNMRDECYKTWFEKGRNLYDLNEDNQDFYFYFKKIYSYQKYNKNPLLEKFKKLGYMPKYINKYKNYKTEDSILNEVKKKIEEKINDFCKSYNIEKDLLFSNLRYIINKEYKYGDFPTIINYCPLKYFVVNFNNYSFKIKPIFPYMKIIINYKLKEIDCDEYFKKEKYKNSLIINNYIKGDYFEASAKFALVKLKFPKKKNAHTIILNEIVSMNKIIKENQYYMDEDEEENSEEEDENLDCNEANNNNTIPISKIINKGKSNNIQIENNEKKYIDYVIIDKKEIEKKEEKKEKEKKAKEKEKEEEEEEEKEEEEEEKEEEEEEEEEINIKKNEFIENLYKSKKDEKKIFKNKELKLLLDKFNIKTKTEEFNDEGLSYEAKLFSKDIEDYRNDEIKEQSKNSETIVKSNFEGDESFFLDQFSKWGKALDFAYLYGKKDKKIFMGFQMKCYFENSELSNNAIDKIYIKNSCRKILVNSMKLFNCKITKWYYYLIFYLNRENINENINKDNIKKCDINNIKYFYYDPKNKQFYRKGKKNKLIPIKEIKINNYANLDLNAVKISKFAFEFPENRLIFKREIRNKMRESFTKDLIKAYEMDENSSAFDVLEKIKTSIKLNKSYHLLFNAQCNFTKGLACPRKEEYIYLYKKKPNDSKSIGFVAGLIEKKVIRYIDLSTTKEIEYIYEVLDEKAKYYYILWICKGISIKKRKKGEIISTFQ